MIIAIDFDGTCVTHEYPKVGREIGAVPVLKKIVENGHQLILFTMRSDIVKPRLKIYNAAAKGGDYLTAAVNWFKERDIPLYGINVNPAQKKWTHSPKVYAQLYIDDAALGCPLINDRTRSVKPFVDWDTIGQYLTDIGVLN